MTGKIVIIGAPRSGTNMLRDLLVRLDGVETWPCDEINYIWRHGNRSYPSDEFSADMAVPKVIRYINREFDSIARATDASSIVEKTCANSLRVAFVERVVPEAKYIFIVRDGRDAVASAMKRWKADLDIPYLLKKVRFVPPTDLPYYGANYLYNRVHKLLSRESRLSIWGPRLDGLDELLSQYSLEQVCAIQWQRCVEKAEQDFSGIDDRRIFRLRYEDFVASPAENFAELARFLSLSITDDTASEFTSGVKQSSVGRGGVELDSQTSENIITLISDTLSRYQYAV